MNLIPKLKSLKKINPDLDLRIHYSDPTCSTKLTKAIEKLISNSEKRPLVIVCIGTDRSTGDSLGPLIGMKLLQANLPSLNVFGTLEHPIHAVNLNETYENIQKTYDNPFIIGIDACLGRYNHVGIITAGEGPVLPGAGVNKDLPPIGDAHLTGIVNVSGYMEYFVLQNTRLHVVMTMADIMSHAIIKALVLYHKRTTQTKVNFLGS